MNEKLYMVDDRRRQCGVIGRIDVGGIIMQKIWLLLENQSTFVYVIAGLCFVGILSKLLLQGKLHKLLKASEGMATTKERELRTIRNHYENSLNMDLQIHHIRAFVGKYIHKLKYGGIPIRIWDSLALETALLSLAAGGIGIINAMYRGYGGEVVADILVAAILACAILLSLENLFRMDAVIEQLEANVEDYLDNNLRNRVGQPLIDRQKREQRQREQLAAVASEITTAGRKKRTGESHSRATQDGMEDIPEYEIRRKATRSYEREVGQTHSTGPIDETSRTEDGLDEIAASEEDSEYDASVITEVLRNFFSG
jgi:hypothetical protein